MSVLLLTVSALRNERTVEFVERMRPHAASIPVEGYRYNSSSLFFVYISLNGRWASTS